MRAAWKIAAFSTVGLGAASLAAVDTTGSNLALSGSDELFDVTRPGDGFDRDPFGRDTGPRQRGAGRRPGPELRGRHRRACVSPIPIQ
jgi:hypothetical protein